MLTTLTYSSALNDLHLPVELKFRRRNNGANRVQILHLHSVPKLIQRRDWGIVVALENAHIQVATQRTQLKLPIADVNVFQEALQSGHGLASVLRGLCDDERSDE